MRLFPMLVAVSLLGTAIPTPSAAFLTANVANFPSMDFEFKPDTNPSTVKTKARGEDLDPMVTPQVPNPITIAEQSATPPAVTTSEKAKRINAIE